MLVYVLKDAVVANIERSANRISLVCIQYLALCILFVMGDYDGQ